MNNSVKLAARVGSFGLSLISALSAGVALAAPTFDPSNGVYVGGSGDFASAPTVTDAASLISSIGNQVLNIFLVIVAIIAVLYLVFYGYQYITAGGDPEKATKARGGILNAIIGIVVITLAFTIVHFAVNVGGAGNGVIDNSVTGAYT